MTGYNRQSHGISPSQRNPQRLLANSRQCLVVGSLLQVLVKLAFILGSFLIIFPILLRMADAVDNSFAFSFIAIGILVVIIGELNRARVEELSPYF